MKKREQYKEHDEALFKLPKKEKRSTPKPKLKKTDREKKIFKMTIEKIVGLNKDGKVSTEKVLGGRRRKRKTRRRKLRRRKTRKRKPRRRKKRRRRRHSRKK